MKKSRFGALAMAAVMLTAAVLCSSCSSTETPGGTESFDPDAPVTIKVGIWPKDSDKAGLQAWENYKATMAEKYQTSLFSRKRIRTRRTPLFRWRSAARRRTFSLPGLPSRTV